MPALVATEWRPAPRPAPEEDLLQTAFELAYFIHRDRRTAAEISLAAMQKLEVAAVTQLRRLYYKGRGEGSGRPGRFKPSWADRHLLQRLVYFESEKWERLQEQRDPGSLTEEDYLLRFVKHLSQITMKRSSFYASIAIGRILHAYSTPSRPKAASASRETTSGHARRSFSRRSAGASAISSRSFAVPIGKSGSRAARRLRREPPGCGSVCASRRPGRRPVPTARRPRRH